MQCAEGPAGVGNNFSAESVSTKQDPSPARTRNVSRGLGSFITIQNIITPVLAFVFLAPLLRLTSSIQALKLLSTKHRIFLSRHSSQSNEILVLSLTHYFRSIQSNRVKLMRTSWTIIGNIKMELHEKKIPILLVSTGLVIRLAMSPFSGHPFDIYYWYQGSMSILKGDIFPTKEFVQMPAWYYSILPISYAYQWLSPLLSAHPITFNTLPPQLQSAASWTIPRGVNVPIITDWLYNLLLKIPSISADLATGYVIYRIVLRKVGQRSASFAFLAWFLNPMVIWVSSVWGMFDSLPALFSLLAVYFLLEERFVLCSIMESIAIGYKLYPVFLVPLLILYAYRSRRSLYALIVPLLLSTFLSVFFFLPLFPGGLHIYYLSIGHQNEDLFQAFGLTFWNIGSFISLAPDAIHLVDMAVFFALFAVFSYFSFTALKAGRQDMVFGLTLAFTSIIFFSYPTVNEQWFVWLLPTLIILASRKLISYTFVFGLSTIALLYSWINSEFVAFFLPSYQYGAGSILENFASVIGLETFARDGLLATLGIGFSILLAVSIITIFRKIRQNDIHNSSIHSESDLIMVSSEQ